MSIQETQYKLTLLGDGLQALGVSMAVHQTGEGRGITDTHALRLTHLVEVCGFVAEQLSADLEHELSKGAIPAPNNGETNHV